MMNVTNSQLDNRFRYHKPTPGALEKHAKVTELTLALAKELRDILPDGRNAALELTHLEDVRMRANAAIACDSEPIEQALARTQPVPASEIRAPGA